MGQEGKYTGFFIVFLFLAAVFFYCYQGEAEAAELGKIWKYQEGTAEEQGLDRESWLNAAGQEDAGWKIYQFPGFPPISSLRVKDVGLTTILLPEHPKKNNLLLYMRGQTLHVWLGNRLIYAYDDPLKAKTEGWHRIVLPQITKPTRLTFALHADDFWNLGYFERISLDTEVVQMQTIYLSDLPYMMAFPVALVLFVVMAGYYLKRSAWRRICASVLAFLALFMLWLLSWANSRFLIVSSPEFWYYVQSFLRYLLPVAANGILYEAVKKSLRGWMKGVVCAHAILFLVVLAGEIAGWNSLNELLSVHYLLLMIAEPVAFILVLTSAHDGNVYCRDLLIPMVGITALGVIDAVTSYFHLLSWSSMTSVFGIYFFATFLLGMMHEQFAREKYVAQRAMALRMQRQRVTERSITDPLTRCYNRTCMDEMRERAVFLSEQNQRPMAMLMLDIDHFKRFNDTFGHEVGDIVLKGFANAIRETILPKMILIRWGGEEFVVFCPCCPLSGAVVIANLIRVRVMTSKLYEDQQVTCSIGVTLWKGNGDTSGRMFQRADQALYQAKETGRNRVEVEL